MISILKCNFKLWICHLNIKFLLDWKKNDVIPKFLRFKLANRHLKNSQAYKNCQIRLLEEETKSKRERINSLEKNAQRVKEELHGTLSVLDFSKTEKDWQYTKAKIAKSLKDFLK